MGKKRLQQIREQYAEHKEKKKSMKELKIIELEEKYIYVTKLQMMKDDD